VLLSKIMSKKDWSLVKRICSSAGVDPVLIAAIGWHETHWGRLGMGVYGYHLGVSCWKRTREQYEYDKARGLIDEDTRVGYLYCIKNLKGLEKQVTWAVERLRTMVSPNPTYEEFSRFAKTVWKPGNPERWAELVWKVYKNINVDYDDVEEVDKKVSIPVNQEQIDMLIGAVKVILNILEEWKKVV